MKHLQQQSPAATSKSKNTNPPAAPSPQAAKAAAEPPTSADYVPVTVENFPRAETDLYFNTAIQQAGGTGKLHHYRDTMPIDKQTVVRANRDTLYSAGTFDLAAGPATVQFGGRGQGSKLLTHHARLELHGPTLSSTP